MRDWRYYLLGLAGPLPSLREGILWSTDRVFSETCARCRALDIDPAVLGPLRDVETVEDAETLGLIGLDRS